MCTFIFVTRFIVPEYESLVVKQIIIMFIPLISLILLIIKDHIIDQLGVKKFYISTMVLIVSLPQKYSDKDSSAGLDLSIL